VISPLRVWTLAVNTVREAIRNKLLYSLLFFAIALIGTGVFVSALSYVEGARIMQDVGMAAIRIFGTGIAIFLGVGLIHKEVDRRTIYTILSKPVSRTEFLLGKYVGLVLTVWLQLAIMSLAFSGISLASGAPIDAGHAAALLLMAMEMALIVAIATLFSSFTTPMLASLFTVGIYIAGHLTRDMRELSQQSQVASVKTLANGLYETLPDLEMFNLTLQAAHGLAIPASEIWLPVLYGSLYVAGLLMAASFIFERRDFR
jgi:ABC-type transport system involved in multi-copper enzyme maturation permease subunit